VAAAGGSVQGEWGRANAKAVFLDHYARAREVQADSLADDVISIADDSQYDTAIDEKGKTVVDMAYPARPAEGRCP
jgi:hypothetical protein